MSWKWECCYQMEADKFHWALVDIEQRDGGIGDNINRVINHKLVLLAHNDHPCDGGEFIDDDLRLVEAAPDMLKALQTIASIKRTDGVYDKHDTASAIVIAERALAMVTGGETS